MAGVRSPVSCKTPALNDEVLVGICRDPNDSLAHDLPEVSADGKLMSQRRPRRTVIIAASERGLLGPVRRARNRIAPNDEHVAVLFAGGLDREGKPPAVGRPRDIAGPDVEFPGIVAASLTQDSPRNRSSMQCIAPPVLSMGIDDGEIENSGDEAIPVEVTGIRPVIRRHSTFEGWSSAGAR